MCKRVSEETTRLSLLKTGEADIACLLQGPLAEEVKADAKLTLAPVYPPNATWITAARSTGIASGVRAPRFACHHASRALGRVRRSGDFGSGLLVGGQSDR